MNIFACQSVPEKFSDLTVYSVILCSVDADDLLCTFLLTAFSVPWFLSSLSHMPTTFSQIFQLINLIRLNHGLGGSDTEEPFLGSSFSLEQFLCLFFLLPTTCFPDVAHCTQIHASQRISGVFL